MLVTSLGIDGDEQLLKNWSHSPRDIFIFTCTSTIQSLHKKIDWLCTLLGLSLQKVDYVRHYKH